MDREALRQHEATYYSAYAEELRELFSEGPFSELQTFPQFVVYRSQRIDGKLKKPPYSPRYHRLADTTKPESWGTLDQALKALSTGYYDTRTGRWEWFNGLGFVFTMHDPYAGMDLDHCVWNNRSIDKWAQNIIDFMQTHTHYSPGDGAHLIFSITKNRSPIHNRKFGNVEFFTHDHYLTLTPNLVRATPQTIEPRDVEAAYLYLSLLEQETDHPAPITRGGLALPAPVSETLPFALSQENGQAAGNSEQDRRIDHLIADMLQERRHHFARYWSGSPDVWSGPTALKPSRSEAMAALLVILADKTGGDAAQVIRQYKRSGMYDPERDDAYVGRDWETGKRVTYLEMSARNAVNWLNAEQKKHLDHP